MPPGQPYNYVATMWTFGERGSITAAAVPVTRFLTAPDGTGLTTELAALAAAFKNATSVELADFYSMFEGIRGVLGVPRT